MAFCALSSPTPIEVSTLPNPKNFQQQPLLFEDITRIYHSELADLSPCKSYKGSISMRVGQGRAVFLNPNGSIDSLHTVGALSCSILIAVAKNLAGEIVNIGMAHVDDSVTEDSLNRFYSRLTGDKKRAIDTYIISGVEQNVLPVLRASQRFHAAIRFLNLDLDRSRNDGAIVDKSGRVYYGSELSCNHPMPMVKMLYKQHGMNLTGF